MAIMLSRRLMALVALGLLGTVLVFFGVRTRPAASAESPTAAPTAAVTRPVAVTPAKAGADGFFADYKMQRDRALSLEASLLRDVINNPLSTAQSRQKAQDQLLALSEEQARLVELEGLAHAEGYGNAAVFFENQGVTVVVGPGHISTSSAARLVQVLARQAGVSPANVVIIHRP